MFDRVLDVPLLIYFSHCNLSLPPENIRKPYGFLTFSMGREMVHWEQICSTKKIIFVVKQVNYGQKNKGIKLS